MGWDESLFGALYDKGRRLVNRRANAASSERRFDVWPHAARLEALARLLSQDTVSVTFVDEPAGFSGDVLLMPRCIDVFPSQADNEAAARVVLAWACASRAVGLVRTHGMSDADALVAQACSTKALKARLSSMAPTATSMLEALDAQARAERDQQGPLSALVRLALGSSEETSDWARDTWARAPATLADADCAVLPQTTCPSPVGRRETAPVWWWGILRLPGGRKTKRAAAPTRQTPDAGGTERPKPVAAKVERVDTPEDPNHENPLVHSFEKVHTLEAYQGGSKRVDGEDELSSHQKALDELDLKRVTRAAGKASSVYSADVVLDDAGDDEAADEPAEFHYDEWHERARRWQRQWCRLTTDEGACAPPDVLATVRAQTRHTTLALRRTFEQLEAARTWRNRQRSGPDVDIDAVVAYRASLAAGHSGDDRLYRTRRPHTRDVAVMVLLDASLSTDGWVANQRVIDVERRAVIALGDALDGLFDEVAVAGFRSQTRRDCRFVWLKRFSESWQLGASRVMALEPAGYTRIGPAVRHAAFELGRTQARQKLLLLVSDGKPSDLDRYEGRYGMADVHRAVTDAQADGVVTHALAVDPAARRWLPSMFGHDRASVAQSPQELVQALAAITGKALAR